MEYASIAELLLETWEGQKGRRVAADQDRLELVAMLAAGMQHVAETAQEAILLHNQAWPALIRNNKLVVCIEGRDFPIRRLDASEAPDRLRLWITP